MHQVFSSWKFPDAAVRLRIDRHSVMWPRHKPIKERWGGTGHRTLQVRGAGWLRWGDPKVRRQFLPWTHVPAPKEWPTSLETSPSWKERTCRQRDPKRAKEEEGDPDWDHLNSPKQSVTGWTPETESVLSTPTRNQWLRRSITLWKDKWAGPMKEQGNVHAEFLELEQGKTWAN